VRFASAAEASNGPRASRPSSAPAGDLIAARLSVTDRLAAGLLPVLLAAGSLALWIVVPAGWLWLASKLTDSGGSHFIAGMLGTPIAVALFRFVLVWINRLYLRVVWSSPPEPAFDEDGDDGEEPRVTRGPLEPLLIVSFVIAATALSVWFLVLAEGDPGMGPW
jgi:hypothetical protein